MSCKNCQSNYDLYDHSPYMLFPCSHTVCSECLATNQFQSTCPICRKTIRNKAVNQELLKIINKYSKIDVKNFY